MEYQLLTAETITAQQLEDIGQLLSEAWPADYGQSPLEEAAQLLYPGRIGLALVEQNRVVGFAGAIPSYGTTGWELHPLVLKSSVRGRGAGTVLLQELERQVANRGGVTLYLGTDDKFGQTSLSDCDLYDNLLERIQKVENKNHHPYEFYQKQGYQIVGVLPDVNGYGKPDIYMAKRIG